MSKYLGVRRTRGSSGAEPVAAATPPSAGCDAWDESGAHQEMEQELLRIRHNCKVNQRLGAPGIRRGLSRQIGCPSCGAADALRQM